MHSSVDSPPPISPMERRGVIEIDTFCTGCNYNLHGQVVTIDERLGFPICRCPECGKFHPAGTGVTAAGVWVRRFASILLFNWIVIVIASFIAIGAAMGGLDAGSIGIYEHGAMQTPDGKAVDYVSSSSSTGGMSYGYVISGTNIPVKNAVYVRGLYPWYEDSSHHGAGLVVMMLLVGASLALGFIAQTLCVSLMWHWSRQRYVWCILVAIMPALLVMIPFITAVEYHPIREQCLERIFSQTAFQCIGMMVGIILGRPLARQIARMVIPPKARQTLAFLWLVDGKKPPM